MISAMTILGGVLLLLADPRAVSLAATNRRAVLAPVVARIEQGRESPSSSRGMGRGGTQAPSAAASATAEEAPVPAFDDRDRERVLRLQAALRDIVHTGLARFKVGLRVIEARSGRMVYGRAATVLMDPASNEKVLATTAALVRLGSDWKFRTNVYGAPPDAEGMVPGDVFLRGSGDPTLAGRDLDELAAELAAHGVTRIAGGVVADPRRVGDDSLPADRSGREEAPTSQVDVNRGMLAVRILPTEVGEPALVILDPPADAPGGPADFVVTNRVHTGEGRQHRVTVEVNAINGVLRIDVVGRIGVDNPGVVYRRRTVDGALASAILFRSALAQAGILVEGRARVGALAPEGARDLLAAHASQPLGLLLRKINKSSDNYEAERLLEAVGAVAVGGSPTSEKGLGVLREVIDELGLDPRSYVARNGSGLGHANRISARAMTDLLRALYLDPRVGPELVQSLSVGGVDGTTRNRFRGTKAARQVRAKTGTLSGKSTLCGLVGDGDEVMAFSIMVQGFKTRGALGAVRGAQVAAVNMMMRYVQERAGAHTRFPAPRSRNVGPSGADYETDGELGPEDEMPDDDSAVDSEPFLALSQNGHLPGGYVSDGGPVGPIGGEDDGRPGDAALVRIGVGGAGSLAGGNTALGALVFLDLGRTAVGFETTLHGTTFHSVAGPGVGSTEWTRFSGMFGPRYHLGGKSLALDLRVAVAVGWLWVHGHDYFANSTSRTWAAGAGVGVRLSWSHLAAAPWLGLEAVGWPGTPAIAVIGVPETLALPPLDLLLSAGASFRLW